MRRQLITLICIFWSVSLSGQVVVPSLDPVLPAEMSSAVAWRIGSTFGLESELYNQEEDASNDAGIETIRSSVLLAYQPGNFVMEFYYAPIVKNIRLLDEETSTIDWEDKNGSETRFRCAIRGNRQISVGLGYYRHEYEESSEAYITSYYEGSFSMRLLDGLLYVAGGLQRISTDLGSEDSIKYNRIVTGAAIQLGDPTDTIFQVEGAVKMTPETRSEKGTIAEVPSSTESLLNIELRTGMFLFGYQYSQTLSKAAIADEDLTETTARYGVGFKLGGLTLGLYRKTWKAEFVSNELEYDTYALTAGYSFL